MIRVWWWGWWRRRPGSVYAIRVRNPRTGWIVRFGYIGKTRATVDHRVGQHLRGGYFGPAKWWAHTYVEHETLWSGYCTAPRLWWEEVWRIVLFLPLYNVQWNRHNPRRIVAPETTYRRYREW